MYICQHQNIIEILEKFNILTTGIIHIGAHDCQEASYYQNTMKISNDNIIWIDAMQHMVDANKKKGIKNIFCQAISDVDNQELTFHESNGDGQASSLLELGTHLTSHPQICVEKEYKVITKKLDTFLKEKSLDAKKYNFWNLDIQGAELMALKGAPESIKYADAIYMEVNENEVYKGCGLVEEVDCFLYSQGFKRVWTDMLTYKWGDALYARISKDVPVRPIMLRHCRRVMVDNLLYHNGIPPIESIKKFGYEETSSLKIVNDKDSLINMKCKKGKTALQYACENQNIQAVKLLLENGANSTINNGEKTLLEIAKELNNTELIEILG